MNPPPFRPIGILGDEPGLPPPLNPQWRALGVVPWSLARLRANINPLFPAGTIVALSNEIRVAQGTPTMYEGQGTQDLVVSTQVKIYIWCERATVFRHLSCDGGKAAKSIQERHLVHAGTNHRAPRGGWSVNTLVKLDVTDGTAYTTSRITIPNHPRGGIQIPIQNGTVGRVTKVMTATDRPRTREQEATSTRRDWWYLLEVGVRKTQWQWVRCQDWIPIGLLEPLHPRDPVALAHDNQVKATERSPAMFTAVSFA